MGKKSLLPHGFKAKSERKALEIRKQLSLKPYEPLNGFDLASFLNITVYTPLEFFPSSFDLSELIGDRNKNKGWSALTMTTKSNNKIIIHNHLHAPSRQQSDLMHELAHVICDHKHENSRDNIKLPFFMREYDQKQEEEANYLGSTMQIPREGLLWAIKRKMNDDEIADYYCASKQMVKFRRNTTGVDRQLYYLK